MLARLDDQSGTHVLHAQPRQFRREHSARKAGTAANGQQMKRKYSQCATCGYTRQNAPSALKQCCGKRMESFDFTYTPSVQNTERLQNNENLKNGFTE
jgi:hypothetical protein